MRTAFTVASALIGALILIIAIVGLMLPEGHVAARTVRVRQTPEQVFAIISDVANMPTWRPGLSRVDILPSDGSGHTLFREHGSEIVTYRVQVSRPPQWRVVSIADENLPYSGTWTYEVIPVAATTSATSATSAAPVGATPSAPSAPSAPLTQITITERGEVHNPFFRFVSRFVLSHTATIDAYLVALGKKVGESVTPEDADPR